MPGVMVIVQKPPLAANEVVVLHVEEIVISLGRLGLKSEYVVGTALSVMELLVELLVRVIILALLLPAILESANVDGLTASPVVGVTELEKVAGPVSLTPLRVVVVVTAKV